MLAPFKWKSIFHYQGFETTYLQYPINKLIEEEWEGIEL